MIAYQISKMASGGSPRDDYKTRNSDFKPRGNRKPPRYGTSFDAELSLNSELQRAETGEYHSLPNNLVSMTWHLFNIVTSFPDKVDWVVPEKIPHSWILGCCDISKYR